MYFDNPDRGDCPLEMEGGKLGDEEVDEDAEEEDDADNEEEPALAPTEVFELILGCGVDRGGEEDKDPFLFRTEFAAETVATLEDLDEVMAGADLISVVSKT